MQSSASPEITKSMSDKRTYKHITLKNKLQCLLVQDDEADKSAAAMDVNVGFALDPKPYYGTAHFLEHMLFQGSKKYPSEKEYFEYMKQNGGMCNAYTWLNNTNYHFECSNTALEGGLDRLAQFFIEPLMGEDNTEREMKAIDSEYNMS
jgi:insulysin